MKPLKSKIIQIKLDVGRCVINKRADNWYREYWDNNLRRFSFGERRVEDNGFIFTSLQETIIREIDETAV